MTTETWGIVAAAGQAQRFGANKLALKLPQGQTVLRASLDALQVGGITHVVVVGQPSPEHDLNALGAFVAAIVPGGAQRSDSIKAGLAAIPNHIEWVAVHDGARPFVTPDLVARVLSAAHEHGAAVPALPCIDTVATSSGTMLQSALDRNTLRRIQTPQIMRRSWLEEALNLGHNTDESSALLRLGHPVALVAGDEENIKVTYPNDVPRQSRRYVTGSGFDVHRFDPNRPLMLGGIHLEGEIGLAGHSDADVLLHALVDALLGALGQGDIGALFPPSDAQWKNADSARFVAEALRRANEAQARIENVDLTVVGERPKIAPHRERIRARIATLLDVEPTAINVKATTTEGLGFTGRNEGLAAQAVVSLSLPDHERGPR